MVEKTRRQSLKQLITLCPVKPPIILAQTVFSFSSAQSPIPGMVPHTLKKYGPSTSITLIQIISARFPEDHFLGGSRCCQVDNNINMTSSKFHFMYIFTYICIHIIKYISKTILYIMDG